MLKKIPRGRINFINAQRAYRIPHSKLKERADFVLRTLSKTKKHKISAQTEVSFKFVRDREIKKWHKQYFNDPTATDVISFPLRAKGSLKREGDVLGDILISVDTAKRAALYYGHSFDKELTLYMIHGLLHLLGYEDRVPAKKKIMDKLQFSLLDKAMQLNKK